jgi:hypothetical protein
MRPARLVVLIVVGAILTAGSLTACGEGSESRGKTTELVVPAGTNDRLQAGEEVTIMPSRLELRVGDTLLIRNEDTTDQTVGPYFVKAGGEIRLTYGKAGAYEGYCPLSQGHRYEIVVTK